MPQRLTSLDWQTPAVELRGGTFTARWQKLIELLFGDVRAVVALPAVINRKTLAELNALGLGAGDAGYLAFETTHGHLLRWTGSAWEFAPGDDGAGYFQDFALTPDSAKWAPCDGSATTHLTMGVTIVATAITPPNFNGTAAYRKSAAAYSATINAAAGASGSTTPGLSGSTANESSHTHGKGTLAMGDPDGLTPNALDAGVSFFAASQFHRHPLSGDTAAGTAHNHGVGTLAVAGHTHGIGTLDQAHVNVLVFFRR